MAKESVLNHHEKASFEIEHFIFHIIKTDQASPIYLDAVELSGDQRQFFKERFADAAEGAQHIFIDSANSSFYSACQQMLNDPINNFHDVSKQLALSFQKAHVGNTLDGAFIIAVVSVLKERQLIFLLKIDHSKVIEYELQDAKAILKLITNTFVEDKKAIQKSALIDMSGTATWQVLATDRSGTAHKVLTSFFANYLTVVEKDTASNLTLKVVRTIRNWAAENRETLGLKGDVAAYKSRGIEYLKGAAEFNTDDCIKAIFKDEESGISTQAQLISHLKDRFDSDGLTGQIFVPRPSSISAAVRKNTRRTAEGVTITWDGTPEERNITIPTKKERDGYYHIVIRTNKIDILDKN